MAGSSIYAVLAAEWTEDSYVDRERCAAGPEKRLSDM